MPNQIPSASYDETLRAIYAVMHDMRAEIGEQQVSQAIATEKLSNIEKHLEKLNGRTAKSEDKLTELSELRAEIHGGWRVAVFVSGLLGSAASWVASHYIK